MGVAEKLKNIPVTMDDEFLADIDRVASEMRESRSFVMRRALRYGLPLLKYGETADTIQLDSPLSSEVAQTADQYKVPRQKVLIESIRAGLDVVRGRWLLEDLAQGVHGPKANITEEYIAQNLRVNPLLRDSVHLKRRMQVLDRLLAEVESQPEGAAILNRLREQLPIRDQSYLDRNSLREDLSPPPESGRKTEKTADKRSRTRTK